MADREEQVDLAFAREKAKRTLPITVFVILGLVAMYLPLPRRFVAFVPLAIAVYLTVRLLQFVKDRAGREKVWPAITLAIVAALAGALLLQVAFYGTYRDYEQCVDGAQTSLARADCEQLKNNSLLGTIVR